MNTAIVTTTAATVSPFIQNLQQQQQQQKPQTSKEAIAANVKALIEQLEEGHSEGLTAYLMAMGRFHNYSFGNILEIARQKPSATRVAGMYAWNQLGRKVIKGEKGDYLYANLNKNNRTDVDVISGNASKSKFRLVGRFSPHANPDYKPQAGESELNTVIATDVLSEGLNMQDCDTIINYDLHWNPVRLIQRFGRIDRIGSTHNKVFGLNFLPEDALDKNLGLKDRLKRRIAEIQETIGEDSAILDPTEKVNQEAMYAIYDNEPSNLDLFEPDEPMGLGEAEGILRQLRAEDPAEFERIPSLRDGIRSGMNSLRPGIFVLCQAGDFQQLFFVDPAGQIETRDAGTILARIKCTPSTPTLAIPATYNAAVMKVYQTFSEEVSHRKTALEHSTSLSAGQRYVAQELKPFSEGLDEADPRRTDIEILQRAYGSHSLSAAIQTELRRIRNNSL